MNNWIGILLLQCQLNSNILKSGIVRIIQWVFINIALYYFALVLENGEQSEILHET
jgi:hypothetical protein